MAAKPKFSGCKKTLTASPSPDTQFCVVLVHPKFAGNIGLIARLMKNFGVLELRIVGEGPLRPQAWRRAKAGREILSAVRFYKTLDESLEDIDYVAGTSGIRTDHEGRHLRFPVTPDTFAQDIWRISGKVALLFGREDYGLFNEELEKCDQLIHIPTAPDYPVLNISHAAAVVLYELNYPRARIHRPKKASGFEKEVTFKKFSQLLELIDWPVHKRANTEIMFRRILGRAVLSKWEFFTLTGILARANNLDAPPRGTRRKAGRKCGSP